MKKAEKSAFLSRRKNYMDLKMLGLSIFLRTREFPSTVKDFLISNLYHIGGVFLILGSLGSLVLLWWTTSKYDITQKLKKYIVNMILGILFLSLILPFLCLYFGAFKKDAILNNSDILGYYGAVIGGAVTVLGVYWTLDYESKKSKQEREHERKQVKAEREHERKQVEAEREHERKQVEAEREHERKKEKEERRKNSLPILRFTFRPEYKKQDFDYTKESTTELNNNYDILLNTSDEYSINKGKRDHIKRGKKTSYRIFQYGDLEIENLGLGAAILSDVYLYRNDKEEIVNNLQVDEINKFIIPPGHTIKPQMLICSNDFSEDDYLCIDFIDIYSNKYRYEISFGKDLSLKSNVSAIEKEMVQVLPELVDTDNT
mgnify:CR=1 FL=1